MNYKLDSKVALITGSTKGIGRETALALAREGMKVIVNFSKDTNAAKKVETDLKNIDAEYLIIQANIMHHETVEEMIAKAVDHFGQIDVLVNNAGITADATASKMSYQLWHDVLQTNLNGAFYCTKACLPIMYSKKSGVIVNISSIMGIIGNYGQINYSASKAALIGFTKTLAKESAKNGVRVNAIAPGFVETEMLLTIPESARQEHLKRIPLGRFAKPQEIANLVCFLSSEASSYINGQVIVIDGGYQ